MCEILVLSGNEELSLSTSTRIPNIQSPKDILVEVHAASVNPIDVMMRGKGSQGSSLIRVHSVCFHEAKIKIPVFRVT